MKRVHELPAMTTLGKVNVQLEAHGHKVHIERSATKRGLFFFTANGSGDGNEVGTWAGVRLHSADEMTVGEWLEAFEARLEAARYSWAEIPAADEIRDVETIH